MSHKKDSRNLKRHQPFGLSFFIVLKGASFSLQNAVGNEKEKWRSWIIRDKFAVSSEKMGIPGTSEAPML